MGTWYGVVDYRAVAQKGGTPREGQARDDRLVVHPVLTGPDVGDNTPTRSSFPDPGTPR